MKILPEVAKDFYTSLETVYDSCNYIHDEGYCEKCPFLHNCLSDTPLLDFTNFCTQNDVTKMLELADNIEYYGCEDADAYREWIEAQTRKELDEEWQNSTH